MAVNTGEIGIYGVLVNDTPDGVIAKAEQIKDYEFGKDQQTINKELYNGKQNKLIPGNNVEITEDNTINVNIDTTIFKVVSSLPSRPATGDENKIHLVPLTGNKADKNNYSEYIWKDNEWEKLGVLDIDLSGYATREDVLNTKTELQKNINSVGNSVKEVKDDLENNYTKKEGYYPDLVAGTAANLEGKNDIINASMYRPTGGNYDVDSGVVSINSIQGNAVAWNQLCENKDYVRKHESSISHLVKTIETHKYAVFANIKTTTDFDNQVDYVLGLGTGVSPYNAKDVKLSKSITKNYSVIITATNIEKNDSVIIAAKSTPIDDSTFTLNNFQLFDLTLIYGAGNEPTTPEQFEADYQRWFGKTLEYEEYDEGSIRPVLATGIKTVGFNLSPITEFNSSAYEWSLGTPLFENTLNYVGQFYIQADFTTSADNVLPGFLVEYTDGARDSFFSEGTAYRIAFSTRKDKIVKLVKGRHSNSGTVIAKNICINFSWSGKRDGEYEPYWEETKALPITSLTSGGEVIFPDGLKRAGSVYDEIFVENGVTKAVKRVGSVDLGTLNYSFNEEQYSMFTIYDSKITTAENYWDFNAICSKYSKNKSLVSIKDKQLSHLSGNRSFVIKDDSIERTNDAFKSALSGTILYYELAEPITYTIDNFQLPLAYKVDDFGTEQVISPEDSVAPVLVTRYGINAVDSLRRLNSNYISVQSDDDFLNKLSSVTGGKWSKVWNEQKGRFEYIHEGNVTSGIPEDGEEGQVLTMVNGTPKWDYLNMIDNFSYGVEWKPDVADPVVTRIGNMSFHKTLPIQSGMKGCIYNPKEKKVVYWLGETDWRYSKNPKEITIGTIASSIAQLTDGSYKIILSGKTIDSPNYYIDRYVTVEGVEGFWRFTEGNSDRLVLEYLSTESWDTFNKWDTIFSLINTNTRIQLHTNFNGYDGEVMVYVPEFYIKSEDTNFTRNVRISAIKIDNSWQHQPAVYVAAYHDTVLNTTVENMGYLSTLPANSAVSVANTNDYCRGGNNNSAYDQYLTEDAFRTMLGKPRTSISRANFRTYVRNANKEILSYRQYKNILYWLWVIEYATFNSQDTFNTRNILGGFQTGGMGAGLTNINGNYWSVYNGSNPITYNGYTNEFGNTTNIKPLVIPSFIAFITGATNCSSYSIGAANGVKASDNSKITVTNITSITGATISCGFNIAPGKVTYNVTGLDGESLLFVCNNNTISEVMSDGEVTVAWPDSTSNREIRFSEIKSGVNIEISIVSAETGSVTIPVQNTQAIRWRGIENTFGDIWNNVDGIIINSSSIVKDGVRWSEVYTTDNPDLYSDSNYQSMELTGLEYNEGSQYIKEFDLGSTAEIIPRSNQNSSTQYKCDYHYTNSGTGLRTLLLGGHAYHGSDAGLVCFYSLHGVANASANVGFRSSCFA